LDKLGDKSSSAGHLASIHPFLERFYGSAAAMPYSTPLMFTSITRFQSSILRRERWRLRHQPGVVDHHIDPPVCLYGCVDQSFDLFVVGDVRRYGSGLAATAGQFVCS